MTNEVVFQNSTVYLLAFGKYGTEKLFYSLGNTKLGTDYIYHHTPWPSKHVKRFMITHSKHRVRLWWKSSRIFSRISLPSSGDHQSDSVRRMCNQKLCFQSPKTFTPKW